uniref:Interleukin n=1 Tax=Monopterus albus TaxID=43700 RepID=A0A3Q3JYQ2_MONAL
MKLFVLCLFAVSCYTLINAKTTDRQNQKKKLKEVLFQLDEVKRSLQNPEKMVNTPPQNIEDCCCLSALQCFRANLQVHFNVTDKKQGKLYKSLNFFNPLQENGLRFCNSGNDEPTCQDCVSHPKVNAREFFNRLESLIQRVSFSI